MQLRLISDVPLGAFLSGGIDSSTVVAYMVEASDKPPVTISVGFEHQGFDEVAHAETVARHLGCEFHALTASPRVEELLPKLAWHFDEPFADSSAVPTYYVSKAARELVTVALSGDGGDELWAGYTRHRVEHWEQRVRGALGPAARAAGWLGQALPLSVKGARSLRHLARESRSGLRAQARLRHVRAGREGAALLRRLPPPGQRLRRARHIPRRVSRLRVAAIRSIASIYVDARTYMIDDVLTKVDRMSMAVSLEAREPLLDHKLLEFAARVPASLKLKDGQSKYLLRRVLEQAGAALDHRTQEERLRRADRRVAARPARADDERAAARRPAARPRHLQRPRGHAPVARASQPAGRPRHRLWQLVMLELWFREFIDRRRTVSSRPRRPAAVAGRAAADPVAAPMSA